MTEQEMRDAKVPWLDTPEELIDYIKSITEQEHDYGTSAYAMSLAATAAFQYVASKLGTTGFQASCADLDFIRRTRMIDGPFILLKGHDALYPQYDLRESLDKALRDWEPWMAEEAKKKLESDRGLTAAPRVVAHWKKLAGVAVLLLAFFVGCATPEELASPPKQYRVIVTAPLGYKHREYVVTSRVIPHVSRDSTGQVTLWALPPEAKNWEAAPNSYPEEWLIEVELIQTPEAPK
jgi:hypothetical protein